MTKPIKIGLTFVLFLFWIFNANAQNQLNKKIRHFSQIPISSKWTIDITDSSTIKYSFSDSIDLCYSQDLSPLRNYCTDTLTQKTFRLIIHFESGWNKQKISKNRSENEIKIDKIRKRIVAFGDSINWESYKTNKSLVELSPLNYVRIVNNWTQEELDLINSIKKIPFDLYKDYGVFIDKNADYITPKRKQSELEDLYLKLQKEGLKAFEIFTKKGVQLEYKTDF